LRHVDAARKGVGKSRAALPQGEQDAIASQILASLARIGLDYRAPAIMKKDRIVWYWIGSHAEYDRLV